jgi:hypothetical protein
MMEKSNKAGFGQEYLEENSETLYSSVAPTKNRPHFDEIEFQKVSSGVKKAWADVPDINLWVERARGNI